MNNPEKPHGPDSRLTQRARWTQKGRKRRRGEQAIQAKDAKIAKEGQRRGRIRARTGEEEIHGG